MKIFDAKKKMMRASFVLLIATAIAYMFGWFILFDRSCPALIFDIDEVAGKKVVAGPLPRSWVIKPPYHGMFFTGEEWPFHIYGHFCKIWAEKKGLSVYDR